MRLESLLVCVMAECRGALPGRALAVPVELWSLRSLCWQGWLLWAGGGKGWGC